MNRRANPSINTDASDKAAGAGHVKRWASQLGMAIVAAKPTIAVALFPTHTKEATDARLPDSRHTHHRPIHI